ncbi:MAG: hypothetical protein JO148_10715 [Acidimicrobiia bacterium]|nr:hypothetical protein [Acidimicrobiia bacterium]
MNELPAPDDEVLAALDALEAALQDNIERAAAVLKRARVVRQERLRGLNYSDIAPPATHPPILELLRENLDALLTTGSTFRRAAAKALHDEGMSMERIGSQFGVTRQRIAALLRESETRSGDPSSPDAIVLR